MIIEPVIRPPAEAGSFLLQVTTGCSADTCTFCGAYLGKPFRVKAMDEILLDLKTGARHFPETRRLFLMDGDALVLSNARLLPILEAASSSFPKLGRISSYANGFNMTRRSTAELQELAAHKLKLIYVGLESGAQEILDRCQKKSTAAEMIEAVRRSQACGIKCSVMVLLGLGGREGSARHVSGTIEALNQMQPRYLSFLSVMRIPGTRFDEAARHGEFKELHAKELLQETRDILQGLKLQKTIFRTDHASNFLPLEGRLPEDQPRLLQSLDAALSGRLWLRPDFLRSL